MLPLPAESNVESSSLATGSLLLNALFYWDYGFREAPVFQFGFAQTNLSGLMPPSDADKNDL